MALISRKSMAMLFLVATLHFISLSFSTKFLAHARGRQLLPFPTEMFSTPGLFEDLSKMGVNWGMGLLPKLTDNPDAQKLIKAMHKGIKMGEKIDDFISKMEKLNEKCGSPNSYCAYDEYLTQMKQTAKSQCENFCVYDQQCKPCPQNSQQPLQQCDPYCELLQPSDNSNNNLQCQKPCGPTQINDAGGPTQSNNAGVGVGVGAHGFGGFTVVGLLVVFLVIRAY